LVGIKHRSINANAFHCCATVRLRHFGENYLQEALDKIAALENAKVCWHFIGPIQSNKTKQIAQNFDWVHSVDRRQSKLRPECD
jgi:uncharacterized pyridoxal phosphate-containing UPF0001 family protein